MLYRPKIYIASPYATNAPTPSLRLANVMRQVAAANTLITCGFRPFWPLANHFLNQHRDRPEAQWLALDLEWLHDMDALLRLSGESRGADKEVQHANSIQLPVFFSLDHLLAAKHTLMKGGENTWR